MGSFQVLQLPPIVQRHAVSRGYSMFIGDSKLPTGVKESVVCLCVTSADWYSVPGLPRLSPSDNGIVSSRSRDPDMDKKTND